VLESAFTSFRATSLVVEFARLYGAEYGHGGALRSRAFEAEVRRDGGRVGISASIAVGALPLYEESARYWDRHVCYGLQVKRGSATGSLTQHEAASILSKAIEQFLFFLSKIPLEQEPHYCRLSSERVQNYFL
jgi:hypothetical protein